MKGRRTGFCGIFTSTDHWWPERALCTDSGYGDGGVTCLQWGWTSLQWRWSESTPLTEHGSVPEVGRKRTAFARGEARSERRAEKKMGGPRSPRSPRTSLSHPSLDGLSDTRPSVPLQLCQWRVRDSRQKSLNSWERCPAELAPLPMHASSGCCNPTWPSLRTHLPIPDHLEPTWKSLSCQITLSHQQLGSYSPRDKTWNSLFLWLRLMF